MYPGGRTGPARRAPRLVRLVRQAAQPLVPPAQGTYCLTDRLDIVLGDDGQAHRHHARVRHGLALTGPPLVSGQ
jgi:hypothetical protein